MIEGHQSETAMAAAVLRAAHQVLDGEPRVLVDPISVDLVPGSSESELGRARVVFDSPFMRTLRASFVLRSAIAEQALSRAVAISYVLPDSHLTGVDVETVSTASTVAAQRGEPWISRHLPSTIEALLRELDYATIEHHGEEEYSALLSTTREDGLPIPGFERIVVAS